MKLALIIALGLMLVVASVFAAISWTSIGETQMGFHGWMALTLGAVLSLAVGGGLMGLVFLSARRGYDDGVQSFED